MGTMRIIFINRGMKGIAASLGFFEVLIWITVVAQVLSNVKDWTNYVAYAGGFAAGNYLGILLEQKLKVGTQVIRIISKQTGTQLMQALAEAGFRASALDAKSVTGHEQIIFTISKRKRTPKVLQIVQQVDKEAFYSIEDIKYASDTSGKQVTQSNRTPFMQLLSTRKSI
jgi:uncharacterized protein YebE (UPF0316 family)